MKQLHRYAGIRLYANLAGMLATGMLEGIGLFLMVPMLALIGVFDSGAAAGVPFVSHAAALLGGIEDRWKLPAALGLFAAVMAGQAYLTRSLTVLNESIEQGFIRRMRLDVYRALMRAEWSFFLKKRKSDFIHIMTQELSRASYGIYLALRLATTLLFTAVQVGLAAWLSWQLTASILAAGAALALALRPIVRKSKTNGAESTELHQRYYAGMTEHFNGIKDIKTNGMEAAHLSWFERLCEGLDDNAVRFARLQASSQFYYKAVSGALIAGFVYLAFEVLRVESEKVLLVAVLFSRLWPRFLALQASLEQLVQSLPAFKSLSELQRECETEAEENVAEADDDDNTPGMRMERGIECRGLDYRYDRNGAAYALQAINLTIPANGMTAIVGKSGAGKSTLIDLLVGLLRPERGEVLVDGRPLAGAEARALRRSVGYVSQDPFLFHASIRDNLAIARPGASEDAMWEALRAAASETFVRRLPLGLDTVLGDRGVRLSGGERQRIVLARALLRQPAVLVLDEATSALDGEHEARIQEALDRLKGSMTIIVIAHRLSTIRGADQVAVLESGRLARLGEYRQLAGEEDGPFGKLLSYQRTSSG
nr:ABC transporter ATP-binding protein [Paenibacillus sp. UNC496MF]